MTRPPSDRIAGAAMIVAAILIALQARTFTVRFLTDPIGPKALPILVALMFALAGGLLVVRPGPEPQWPGRATWTRGGFAVVSLVLYAHALPLLGFLVATTLEVTVLTVLFRGRLLVGLTAAVVYSAVLYVLFVFGFGLPLPVGSLFLLGN